jgi:ubiquinone/menaquinone biosynthesis C-methylase UbiE
MNHSVRRYYDERVDQEWERLEIHRMEFALTSRLLEQQLPPAAAVLDCGGGPGRYAIWLAEQGHDVTLLDISPRNVRRAKDEAAMRGLSVAAVVGDATDLREFADASFDAALLMGPLYHLREQAERERCVTEAVRVLRGGGQLAASFITRAAVLRYFAQFQPQSLASVYADLQHLIHHGVWPVADASFGEVAYFAHPDEVEPLLTSCGLDAVGVFGVEGYVAGLEEETSALGDEDWESLVELNLLVAGDSTLLSAADHLLAIARKPAG